jgi:hypothetical protein
MGLYARWVSGPVLSRVWTRKVFPARHLVGGVIGWGEGLVLEMTPAIKDSPETTATRCPRRL